MVLQILEICRGYSSRVVLLFDQLSESDFVPRVQVLVRRGRIPILINPARFRQQLYAFLERYPWGVLEPNQVLLWKMTLHLFQFLPVVLIDAAVYTLQCSVNHLQSFMIVLFNSHF